MSTASGDDGDGCDRDREKSSQSESESHLPHSSTSKPKRSYKSGAQKRVLAKEREKAQLALVPDPKQRKLTGLFKSPVLPALPAPSPSPTPSLSSKQEFSPPSSPFPNIFSPASTSAATESDMEIELMSPSPDIPDPDGDRASSSASTLIIRAPTPAETETAASELPLSATNPFQFRGFQKSTGFSENDKKILIAVHPVQPESTATRKIKLPFSSLSVYYQGDGERRMWLSFSECDQRIFCWICVGFALNRKSPWITGWGKGEGAGADWKNCSKAITTHDLSAEHMHAVESFHMFQKDSSVGHKIDTNCLSLRKRQITQRREAVLRIIEIIYFLAKQSLPFRSANKEALYALNVPCNHGNFLEAVKSRATFDPILRAHLDSAQNASEKRHQQHPSSRGRGSLTTFLSKTTYTKVLEITTRLILEQITDDVKKNGSTYSITMDGTQDVSVQEIMSFVLRYVDEYGPVEHLVDISVMESTSSNALLEYTLDVLEKRLSLRLEDLKGYSFDGAGNMAGINSGLQALLKERVPLSVFQHCYAHVLSLSLEKTCSSVLLASSTFDLLRDTCTTISESYKRSGLWKSVSSFICAKTRLFG